MVVAARLDFRGFRFKLLKINELLVEAAGVEPDDATENTQLVYRGNVKIETISTNSESAVRSLYSVLREFPELPTSTSDALVRRKAF